MVGGQQLAADLVDPVDREQKAPELARRERRLADRLEHLHLALVRRVLELELDPIEGVPGRPAVDLEQDAVQLARSTPALGAVVELAELPPGPRARDEPRRPPADAIVDPREDAQRLVVPDEARRADAARQRPRGAPRVRATARIITSWDASP